MSNPEIPDRKENPEKMRELFVAIEQWLGGFSGGDREFPADNLSEREIAETVKYFNVRKQRFNLNYVMDRKTPPRALIFHLLPKDRQ